MKLSKLTFLCTLFLGTTGFLSSLTASPLLVQMTELGKNQSSKTPYSLPALTYAGKTLEVNSTSYATTNSITVKFKSTELSRSEEKSAPVSIKVVYNKSTNEPSSAIVTLANGNTITTHYNTSGVAVYAVTKNKDGESLSLAVYSYKSNSQGNKLDVLNAIAVYPPNSFNPTSVITKTSQGTFQKSKLASPASATKTTTTFIKYELSNNNPILFYAEPLNAGDKVIIKTKTNAKGDIVSKSYFNQNGRKFGTIYYAAGEKNKPIYMKWNTYNHTGKLWSTSTSAYTTNLSSQAPATNLTNTIFSYPSKEDKLKGQLNSAKITCCNLAPFGNPAAGLLLHQTFYNPNNGLPSKVVNYSVDGKLQSNSYFMYNKQNMLVSKITLPITIFGQSSFIYYAYNSKGGLKSKTVILRSIGGPEQITVKNYNASEIITKTTTYTFPGAMAGLTSKAKKRLHSILPKVKGYPNNHPYLATTTIYHNGKASQLSSTWVYINPLLNFNFLPPKGGFKFKAKHVPSSLAKELNKWYTSVMKTSSQASAATTSAIKTQKTITLRSNQNNNKKTTTTNHYPLTSTPSLKESNSIESSILNPFS